MHHVTKPCNSFWSVPPKVSVDAWVGDAIIEAVDDVFLRDIRNGVAKVLGLAFAEKQQRVDP
jgi:hypothetical protein